MPQTTAATSTAQGALGPSLALGGSVLLWGSSFIAMKLALVSYHPIAMMAMRMVCAGVAMACVLPRMGIGRYQAGDWKLIALMAFSEPCLYFLFEAYALANTSASQAGMIVSVLPLLVAVTARFTLNEPLTRRMTFGFSLSIAGVVWLTLAARASEHAPNPFLGNLLEFLAMCCATGYMVLVRHLSSRYNPWFLTAMQAFAGTVFFLPMLLLPGVPLPPLALDLPTLAVVYLGLVITLGAYGLYNLGTSRVPAGRASAWVNCIPVVTLVLAHFGLGEELTGAQYLASGLVLLGVWLSQERRHRPRRWRVRV